MMKGFNKICALDIETMPEREEIVTDWSPEPAQLVWTDDMSKTGHLKDPEKIQAKILADREKAIADHEAEEAARQEKFRSGLCLKPHLSRVFAFVVKRGDDGGMVRAVYDPTPTEEKALIGNIWDIVSNERVRSTIVGWNWFGFDLPFLICRSRILGVPHPPFELPLWKSENHIDLMREWTLMNAMGSNIPGKLNDAGRILGLGEKVDLGDRLVWELYRDGEQELGAKYILQDGDLTYKIAKHLQQARVEMEYAYQEDYESLPV